jgi:hypothetical protein
MVRMRFQLTICTSRSDWCEFLEATSPSKAIEAMIAHADASNVARAMAYGQLCCSEGHFEQTCIPIFLPMMLMLFIKSVSVVFGSILPVKRLPRFPMLNCALGVCKRRTGKTSDSRFLELFRIAISAGLPQMCTLSTSMELKMKKATVVGTKPWRKSQGEGF